MKSRVFAIAFFLGFSAWAGDADSVCCGRLQSCDSRLRVVSVHCIGQESAQGCGSALNTGFFRDVQCKSPCRILVGEAVGKTRCDPWRALVIHFPEGDGIDAVVSLKSVYPAEVRGAAGTMDAKANADGAICIPLKPGETAVVSTKYAVSDILPSMDRSKFLVGAWGGMSGKARSRRHIQWLDEAGIDFVHINRGFGPEWKESFDFLHEHKIGAIVRSRGYWFGGSGKAAGQMRSLRPSGTFDGEIAELSMLRHPAIWMLEISDEPSALDMEYIGEISAMAVRRNPEIPAYVNLYPNYALVASNSDSQRLGQLGRRSYAEYIDEYCRTMPCDFICYDHYPFGGDEETVRMKNAPRMYSNLQVVADACRRTGRSFWMIPQVNSRPRFPERLTEGHLRFQASVSMAYGCEALMWATWTHTFWTNSVLTSEGELSGHYGNIARVNAGLHRLGTEYMRFRNVGTKLCRFPQNEADMLFKRGVRTFPDFSCGGIHSLCTEDGSAFAAGEMVARDGNRLSCAALVVPVADMSDRQKKIRRIVFKSLGDVKVFGFDGPVVCSRDSSGRCSFELKDGYAALVVCGRSPGDR